MHRRLVVGPARLRESAPTTGQDGEEFLFSDEAAKLFYANRGPPGHRGVMSGRAGFQRRRARTAAARVSSTATVSGRARHASVMLTP